MPVLLTDEFQTLFIDRSTSSRTSHNSSVDGAVVPYRQHNIRMGPTVDAGTFDWLGHMLLYKANTTATAAITTYKHAASRINHQGLKPRRTATNLPTSEATVATSHASSGMTNTKDWPSAEQIKRVSLPPHESLLITRRTPRTKENSAPTATRTTTTMANEAMEKVLVALGDGSGFMS
ncbi:MAG: hypothetical protein DLM55_03120 [Acidimicrobiales bacterium]|nr:MAG: hypothetical protein DLM55_03120 [Acidimicrobiales bacterium]